MTRDELLRRVEDDLSLGHTHLAINRLTMAAKAAPSDLALRTRLAVLHRQTGNWAEAGRWGYFEDPIDDRSRQAFEKAWRDPQAQRSALRWARSPSDPDIVRVRLDALDELVADEARRRPPMTRPGSPGSTPNTGGLLVCLIVGVLVALFLVGVLTGAVALVRLVT